MRRAKIGKDRKGEIVVEASESVLGCDSFFLAGFQHIVSSPRAELAPNCLGAQRSYIPQPRPTRMGKIIDLARSVGVFVSKPCTTF